LTVSEDPRFVETVRELTAKTAETVGIPAVAASRLAVGVERIVRALAERQALTAARGPRLLDVRFLVGPDALRVEIECEAPSPGEASARSEWSIAQRLEEHGDLDALRALALDMELAIAGSPCLCRFTCAYASRS
jgi:hypothetical protein